MDAADGRLLAGVVEWLFGEILPDVMFIPADQRSLSIKLVIWRSVAGMLWQMAC